MSNVPKRFALAVLILGSWSCEPGRLTPGGRGAEALHGTEGTWASAGTVGYLRYDHTSTTLGDGTVLVAGGMTRSGVAAESELFLPGGVLTPLPPMRSRRWFHTASLLGDGRVLLAGGLNPNALGSAELYDPPSRTFSFTGSLAQARSYHSAAALADGRILLTGGETIGSGSGVHSSAELYDPATGTFALTGPMLAPRSRHASIRLPGGKVLVAGGIASNNLAVQTAELFDPATGTFSATGMMNLARRLPSLVLLGNGKVLVVDGVTDLRAELYDPATGLFTFTGSTLVKREGAGVALLRTGEVLLAAGVDNTSPGTWHTSSELYDPVTETWRATGALSQVRAIPTTSVLADGRVAMFGGLQPNGAAPLYAEAYTPSTPDTVDTTPPSVAIASPSPGAPVGPVVSVTAAVADDDYVSQVELLGNGVPFAQGTTGTWSTSELPEGPATIAATAVDLQGNQATASIQVTVDHTLPTVAFTSPANGASITGTVTVSANAADANGLGQVTFHDGATLIGSFAAPPYAMDWSTAGPLGQRTLTVRALDRAGNLATASINVNVISGDWTPPTVSLTAPAAYALVRGSFTATATASDNAGTPRVEFLVNGAVAATDTTSPYSAPINSAPYPDGPLTLAARAVDGANNKKTSASITVYVDNTPPVVAITSPAPGSTVSGPVTITATATDARGLSRVELYDGSTRIGTDGVAPYAVTWTPSAIGTRTLTARAYDYAGNMTVSAPVSVTSVDVTPPTVSLTAPAANAWVRGYFTATAVAADNVAISRAEFRANGIQTTVVTGSPCNPCGVALDSRWYPDGPVEVTVRVLDSSGNQGNASVTVNADNTAPSVSITAPAAGAAITGPVTVSAGAVDGSGVTRVELYDGSFLIATDTVAPFEATWTPTLSGVRRLTARAYDLAGNMATSAAVDVNVSLPPPPPVTGAAYSPALRAPACTSASIACDSAALLDGRAGLGPEPNQPNTIGGTCADGTYGSYPSSESIDRLRVVSVDGTPIAAGTRVRIEATVWIRVTLDRLDLFTAQNANAPAWTLLTTLVPAATGLQTFSAEVTLPSGDFQAVRASLRYGGTASACPSGSYNDHDDLAFAVQ